MAYVEAGGSIEKNSTIYHSFLCTCELTAAWILDVRLLKDADAVELFGVKGSVVSVARHTLKSRDRAAQRLEGLGNFLRRVNLVILPRHTLPGNPPAPAG